MTRAHRLAILGSLVLASALAPAAGSTVTSATFTFDFITDPGDLADGSDFDVVGVGPIDDGSACDQVAMVMVDATGTPTDVDSFCLDLVMGQGGSDGDYGSFETGYVPVAGPVTYALFDLTAADLAALTGFGDSQQEFFDYVVANCTLLGEATVPVQGLASTTPFAFAAATGAHQCYQTRDLKSPKFAAVDDLAVADEFATGAVDVKKPYRVCAPAGVDGAAIAPSAAHLCCYKIKGAKLPAAEDLQIEDGFGTHQVEIRVPKEICTACTTTGLPLP
jgi:hypothetical protein